MSAMCFLCRFVRLDYPFLEHERDEDPERAARTFTSGINYGRCCRHAPIFNEQGGVHTAKWPKVYLTDWCGEFERYVPPAALRPPEAPQ